MRRVSWQARRRGSWWHGCSPSLGWPAAGRWAGCGGSGARCAEGAALWSWLPQTGLRTGGPQTEGEVLHANRNSSLSPCPCSHRVAAFLNAITLVRWCPNLPCPLAWGCREFPFPFSFPPRGARRYARRRAAHGPGSCVALLATFPARLIYACSGLSSVGEPSAAARGGAARPDLMARRAVFLARGFSDPACTCKPAGMRPRLHKCTHALIAPLACLGTPCLACCSLLGVPQKIVLLARLSGQHG